MAQFYPLYVDPLGGSTSDVGALVVGPLNAVAQPLPKFVQGDTIQMRVYLLDRTSTYPLGTPYTITSNGAFSLKVAIGPKDGTAGSSLLTQQFTCPADSLNQYFTVSLPLNTAAITAAIGSASFVDTWLEFEISQGGLYTTVLQKSIRIEAEVIDPASLTVPAGSTAISAEEVNAQFLKREIHGAFVLVNDTTGQSVTCYLGDDGAVHWDPIS